ncbi:MAG TPA: IS630 family transposase [Thermoanaerobaculia bacterium]|nr:IS630 family transposase [Thermoanaerobaculia bacterium]
MRTKPPLIISTEEETELQRRVRLRGGRAEDTRRARLILMLAAGEGYREIKAALGCDDGYIVRWRARFLSDRLAGLYSRYRGRKPEKLTPRMEARILDATRRKPDDGSTHWTTRKLARKLGIDHMKVARTWARAGLKPHRIKRYMLSNDPDFETKAADVIALYVNPPQHAVVFSLDEKTAIQALDRLDPVLPLSPGRLERHGFEYFRHGTLSLYAALNVKTGEVIGETCRRHTTEEFVAFLGAVVASQPKRKEIHIVLDNLSTHKTKRVHEFLASHPNVHLHFTPTYSSWLNQIEIWFSKIERDLIARGIFTSVNDLRRKIVRYIKSYNKAPKPIRWTYTNVINRITGDSTVTVH